MWRVDKAVTGLWAAYDMAPLHRAGSQLCYAFGGVDEAYVMSADPLTSSRREGGTRVGRANYDPVTAPSTIATVLIDSVVPITTRSVVETSDRQLPPRSAAFRV